MADSSINIGELKNISNQIKDDTNKISDLYKNTISTALENCKEDLTVSGVNFNEVQTSFQKLFTSLTSQLDEFTNAMNTKIIPSYETTAVVITKLFNEQFANEMNEYLNIINSD